MSMAMVFRYVWATVFTLCVAGVAVLPANAQITFYEEDFADVSDWTTFGASISTDGDIGTITADVDYGKAEATLWSVAQFGCGPNTDSLYVDCTAVTGRFVVKVMEEVPPYSEITVIEGGYNTPGLYSADIGAITGWIGQKSFKIVVWVEWATPGTASFDEIRVVNTGGWSDDFEPIAVGWRDDNTNPGFNATVADLSGPYAIVQELPGVDWGKVLSPVLTMSVDDSPTLTAVVQSDAEMSNFVFAIQEEEGSYRYYELGRGYEAGIFVYNVKAITGWSGVHAFSIQVSVESQDIDGWVVLDSITLDCSEAPPVSTESKTWGNVKALFK